MVFDFPGVPRRRRTDCHGFPLGPGSRPTCHSWPSRGPPSANFTPPGEPESGNVSLFRSFPQSPSRPPLLVCLILLGRRFARCRVSAPVRRTVPHNRRLSAWLPAGIGPSNRAHLTNQPRRLRGVLALPAKQDRFRTMAIKPQRMGGVVSPRRARKDRGRVPNIQSS
jgi:hypothetical protein